MLLISTCSSIKFFDNDKSGHDDGEDNGDDENNNNNAAWSFLSKVRGICFGLRGKRERERERERGS